jgi:glucose/arabinose dehydrogenase
MNYRFLMLLICLCLAGLAPACGSDSNTDPSDLESDAGDDAGDDGGDVASFRLSFEEISFGQDVEAITEIKFIPGAGQEFLVLRKDGEVLHFELDGDTASQLGSVTLEGVDDTHDCGLLSMAFDPDFEQNQHAYFGYCVGEGQNVITRHTLDTADLTTANDEALEVFRVDNPNAEHYWHNVGSIQFGDDGYLWALFGENAHGAEAQELSRATGSLIRIEPDPEGSEQGWQPAPDNPFVGDPDKNEAIYAWGLRSPWRGLIDTQGRYWIGDVGASKFEEINVADEPGLNFGWPDSEGPCETDCDDEADPILWWDREPDHAYVLDDPETAPTDRRAVWVGLAYESTSDDDPYDGNLDDKVIYGDFCAGWVRAAAYDDEQGVTFDASIGHLEGVASWATGPDGYAYVTTYGNCRTFPYKPGKLYRAVLETD